MNILYLNLHARIEPFVSHKAAQEKTWARGIQNNTLWIVGAGHEAQNPIVKGNELEIPVDEEFDNILMKRVFGIRWALENYEFDFIVCGNTSNYFDDCMVSDFLKKFDPREHFAGSELGQSDYNLENKTNPGQYLSGTGVILSRKTAEIFNEIDLDFYRGWPDDVALSHHISQQSIQFTRIPRGDITDFKPIKFTSQYRVKSWSNIDYAESRMFDLDRILKSNLAISLMSFILFNLREYWRYSLYFPPFRGLNCLRHLRQILWIFRSLLFFPYRRAIRKSISVKQQFIGLI